MTRQSSYGWPAASTLIAAMIGAAATAIAMAVAPTSPDVVSPSDRYASAREIGEVKARLTAIEESTRQMRTELRSDIKELRELMQRWLNDRES